VGAEVGGDGDCVYLVGFVEFGYLDCAHCARNWRGGHFLGRGVCSLFVVGCCQWDLAIGRVCFRIRWMRIPVCRAN